MKSSRSMLLALVAAATSLPATAHIVPGGVAHWHAGDLVGVVVVVALTGVAAWIDRHWR